MIRAISPGSHQRRCGESPLPIHDDPHTEAEALSIGDKGYFVGLIASALRRQAVSGKLLAIAVDADIGVAGAVLFGLRQSYGAELFEFRAGFGGGIIGRAEQSIR